MKLLYTLGCLFFLFLFISPVSGNATVLNTQLQLLPNSPWDAVVSTNDDTLFITVATTQGVLNLALIQNNETIIDFELTREDGEVIDQIDVLEGDLLIVAEVSGNFIPALVSISLEQEEQGTSGLLIGAGALIILSVPFVYVFGRYQGKSL